jgi:hypothetical protein
MVPTKILREKARAKITAGKLPSVDVREVCAGYGGNEVCDVCGQSITAHAVVYEVEVPGRRLRFHIACHAAWQTEAARAVTRPARR